MKEYQVNGQRKSDSKIYRGSFTEEPMITLESTYQTLNEAEAAIIRSAMRWIDDHLG